MEMALNVITYPDLKRYNKEGLEYALSQLAKNGITSVTDARSYWDRRHDEVWEQVEAENKLTARAVLGKSLVKSGNIRSSF